MVDLSDLSRRRIDVKDPSELPRRARQKVERRIQQEKRRVDRSVVDRVKASLEDARLEERELDARLAELGPWWSAPSREWRRRFKKVQAGRDKVLRLEAELEAVRASTRDARRSSATTTSRRTSVSASSCRRRF